MDDREVVLLADGYWLQPDWSDDESDGEWIITTWIVYQDDQHHLFSHSEKQVVEQWLREQGYRRIGRGTSYRRVTQGKQALILNNAIE